MFSNMICKLACIIIIDAWWLLVFTDPLSIVSVLTFRLLLVYTKGRKITAHDLDAALHGPMCGWRLSGKVCSAPYLVPTPQS